MRHPCHRSHGASAGIRRTVIVGVAFFLALVFGGITRADDRTSSLSWVRLPGAESCISASELSSRVDARLRRSVFVSPSTADVSIEGHVEARQKGQSFRVFVTGTRRDGSSIGSRELSSSSADCRSVDESLVLVVALMIDPDAAMAPVVASASASASSLPAPSASQPPVAVEPPREVVRERLVVRTIEKPVAVPSSSWKPDLRLDGALSSGRVPEVAWGPRAAFRFGPSRFAIELSVGAIPLSTQKNAGHTLEVQMVETGAAVCPRAALGQSTSLSGCFGLRLGGASYRGKGYDEDKQVMLPVFDLDAGGRVQHDLPGGFFLLAGGSILLPILRQQASMRVDSRSYLLYERPSFGLEAMLGLGMRISH